MPEYLKDKDKRKCYKCNLVYDKNKKQCKVCKCHSITYCSEECQREDWPRHRENCVPVMVKKFKGKGRGLVAARDIKMGELILTDTAAVTNDDIGHHSLTPDAERLLINQKILKDISILNHSCAPNAAMGLLVGEENDDPAKTFELRAVKDISKKDEVTIFYPAIEDSLLWLHADMREKIQEDFGFDCKCSVCSGEVPNQDAIMLKIHEIYEVERQMTKSDDEMTLLDWTRQALAFEAMVELAKPIYMGREETKLSYLTLMSMAALKCSNPALLEKALDGAQVLAEKLGLRSIVEATASDREVFHSAWEAKRAGKNIEEMMKEKEVKN